LPRAQISGFTVISGSRILVPTEIATIDSAVVLPVTGTVEWVGTIGTIQTVVEVGTIDLVLDIATVQTVVGTIKTQEIGGTITATILGTISSAIKRDYSYDILVSTILSGTNPATIVSSISDIRGYYQKLISAYFTGTTMATILIEASRYSDSEFSINYPIGTINVVGTVADGKAYETLTDNWGYLRTTIVISTIDTGSLNIEVDKQV
jgi:hypothetical protein